MFQCSQGFVSRELARVRRDGRAAVLWSSRVTIAATANCVVASLIFPGTQPLLAPLTAMLVVQVTPLSLLASGLDRVVAVVAGVLLAVGFAAVVPLEWWNPGLLILVSITIGQYLRLRSNLVEVAISAMLVLGVGAIGAEAAAWQRIAETLVGAAVGIVGTLLFPPKVPVAMPAAPSTGWPTRSASCWSVLQMSSARSLTGNRDGRPRRTGLVSVYAPQDYYRASLFGEREPHAPATSGGSGTGWGGRYRARDRHTHGCRRDVVVPPDDSRAVVELSGVGAVFDSDWGASGNLCSKPGR